MAMKIVLQEAAVEMVTVTERLCLTEDGRLVEETDPAARWLWATPGTQKPRVEAEKYGYVKQHTAANTDPAAPPNKAMAAPPNKATDDLEALRARATTLGIKVDGRWSLQRLQQEINTKETS